MCSRSSGSLSKEKISGMPSMPQGLATGSNQPTAACPHPPCNSRSCQGRAAPACRRAVRNRLGHDVEMLRRVQRHADATSRATLARPHPSAVDNDFSLDVPALGRTPAARPSSPRCPVTLASLDDPRAAGPRALRERPRSVDRVRLAVLRQMNTPPTRSSIVSSGQSSWPAAA